jgi:ATP-dependent DNA helicase RecG
VFGELGWVEDLGSGMRNILLYAPIYYTDYRIDIENKKQFLFSITYTDVPEDTTQRTPPTTTQRTIPTAQKPVSTTTQRTTPTTTQRTAQKEILNYLKEHPSASMREISLQLGDITEGGVKYHIIKLRRSGIIKRVGPKFGGIWKILKSLDSLS